MSWMEERVVVAGWRSGLHAELVSALGKGWVWSVVIG